MFKFFKNFFYLSNSELKGALLLLFLIIAIVFIPRVYYAFKKPIIVENIEFDEWLSDVNFKEDSIEKYYSNHINNSSQNKKIKQEERFQFDPNSVSYKDLIRLGFSTKLASVLIKYREKGAKFKSKQDLLKIYGFSESLFSKYENFIVFPENETVNKLTKTKENEEIIYFKFDPNKVSYSEMKSLGIDSKTARILLKFREKGAFFYNKEDLLKVYGFTEKKYLELEDYIVFPKKEKKESKENKYINDFKIDVNLADTSDFKKLKGIGSIFSKRIIKYRTKLGGFNDIEQLKEVYGISDSLFNNLKENLILSSTTINQISLNNASFKELISHPYISKELTIAILKLRRELGGLNKVEDLTYYDIVTETEFEKIKNYIKL